MRIATWNVNSLKARLEKLLWWLERASPDVLLMQETKLVDSEAGVLRAIFEKIGGASGSPDASLPAGDRSTSSESTTARC